MGKVPLNYFNYLFDCCVDPWVFQMEPLVWGLLVLWLWGCDSSDRAGRTVATTEPSTFTQFKTDAEALFAASGWELGTIDWSAFDAAVGVPGPLKGPFIDTIGLSQVQMEDSLLRINRGTPLHGAFPSKLIQVLVAARFIAYSVDDRLSAEDRAELVRMAGTALREVEDRKISHWANDHAILSRLCELQAELEKVKKSRCDIQALAAVEGRLVATIALKKRPNFDWRYIRQAADFYYDVRNCVDRGIIGPLLLEAIAAYWEFHRLYLKAPLPSVAATNERAVALVDRFLDLPSDI